MVDNSTAPDDTNPRDAVITIGLDLDDISIGVLRWLVQVAEVAGIKDSETLIPVYDPMDTSPVIIGLELHVNASRLPTLARKP